MARCPHCRRPLKITLEKVTDAFHCENCNAGPLKISRSSGYVFALGLAAYFAIGFFCAVIALGVNPDELVFYTHSSANQGGFPGLILLIGFLVWIRYWTALRVRKYASLA